jgi:ABC-type polysaccharide/polyol phosphate export permease
MAEEWRDIAEHGHLLYNLVYRDLTVRYKRSVIGFFWTMLNPLLLMLIFVVVFSTLFRFQVEHYQTYFLSEYLAWTFFAQTTVQSMQSVTWNGPLMKRVRVPKSIFPLATTIAGVVNLALSYVPLLGIMLVAGVPIRPAILFLPVSFAILAVFTFGFVLALTATAIYFVDVREMWGVLVNAIMYTVPIIYPITILPERFRRFVDKNPLMYLLQTVRDPVYNGRIPTMRDLGIATFSALAAFFIGWAVFRRLSRGFYPRL